MWDIMNFCISPLVVLGLLLRLLTRRYASKEFLESFTYSPIDQWDSLLEGIYLMKHGFSPYENNVVHQPPLALYYWSKLLSLVHDWDVLLFLFMELVMMFGVLLLGKISTRAILNREETIKNIHISSKSMILSEDNFRMTQTLIFLCYCVNPYSIVAFAARSTSIVWCIIAVWSLIACFTGHNFLASCLCALGCYLRFYPVYMLVPILASAYTVCPSSKLACRILRLVSSVLGFAVTLAGLLWASFLLEGHQWQFVNSVYLHQFTFADCTPQLGVYWYMFVEMFEHFQDLFVWVFQLLLPTLVIALLLRFHSDVVFLSFLVGFLVNVLQPYHSVGEFGYILSLLPVWSHLVKHARMPLITLCVLLAALVLTPLFRYMWLQPGTANANFYFAACMVYAVGQNLLFADLLNAYDKREFFLRVGSMLKLKSGHEVVLAHS